MKATEEMMDRIDSEDETQDGMTPEEQDIWNSGYEAGIKTARGPSGPDQMKVMLMTLLMSSLKQWIKEDPDKAVAEIDKTLSRLPQ